MDMQTQPIEATRTSVVERDPLTRGLGWFSVGLGLTQLLMPRALAPPLAGPHGH